MDSTDAQPPVLAGRYRLGSLLGRGGMSEVYRADDLTMERPVAVKLLRSDSYGSTEPAASPPHWSAGSSQPSAMSAASAASIRRRLSIEARILAGLDHPNLVQVFDLGAEAGRCFLVMELVEGGTLADVVALAPLPPRQVALVGAQLAGALAVIHAAGFVHRDIKPSNVLVSDADCEVIATDAAVPSRVRLTDLGVARILEGTRMTSTGLMLGTAQYLSPEQVLGDRVGCPSDIYGLGLLLLECLTGEHAYPGPAVESAVARLHRQPAVPDEHGPEWLSVLSALTARQPGDRPTAGEAHRVLSHVAHAAVGASSDVRRVISIGPAVAIPVPTMPVLTMPVPTMPVLTMPVPTMPARPAAGRHVISALSTSPRNATAGPPHQLLGSRQTRRRLAGASTLIAAATVLGPGSSALKDYLPAIAGLVPQLGATAPTRGAQAGHAPSTSPSSAVEQAEAERAVAIGSLAGRGTPLGSPSGSQPLPTTMPPSWTVGAPDRLPVPAPGSGSRSGSGLPASSAPGHPSPTTPVTSTPPPATSPPPPSSSTDPSTSSPTTSDPSSSTDPPSPTTDPSTSSSPTTSDPPPSTSTDPPSSSTDPPSSTTDPPSPPSDSASDSASDPSTDATSSTDSGSSADSSADEGSTSTGS